MSKMPHPERLTTVDATKISMTGLKGVTAISFSGEHLGSVDDVVMADGNVDAVIIEVGGFAGIGAKKVGVRTSSLDLLIDPYDKYYLRLPVTHEELKVQADIKAETEPHTTPAEL